GRRRDRGVREPRAHGRTGPGLPRSAPAGAAAPDGVAPRGRRARHRARPLPRADGSAGRDPVMARGTLTSELRSAADDPGAVLAYVEAQGWGDGLPVIPPTEARVQAMLEATPLAPAHVVGVVEPRRGEATVEKVAVNAVLAGCRPDCFPAVLAAVEAVCEPRFNLYALNTTTCCATPALMVNGPARRTLGVECGYSCLGQNGRANATIGRALRLVMRNVGGAIPGAVSKSVFGQPGRLSLC